MPADQLPSDQSPPTATEVPACTYKLHVFVPQTLDVNLRMVGGLDGAAGSHVRTTRNRVL